MAGDRRARDTDLTRDQASAVTYFMHGYFDMRSSADGSAAAGDELEQAIDCFIEMQEAGDLDA